MARHLVARLHVGRTRWWPCGVRNYRRARRPNEHGDEAYSGSDTLTASQISCRDQQLVRMSLGGGATTMEVPLKTPLNRVLEITAKDGIYSLHEPIVIGSAFGVDVKLACGDRVKVDAMSETSTQSSTATEKCDNE